MKTSNKFAPVLFLLAVVTAFGLGFISQAGSVMAESAAQVAESVADQASAVLGAGERRCEEREVAADEGYGVSRMERRVVCQ